MSLSVKSIEPIEWKKTHVDTLMKFQDIKNKEDKASREDNKEWEEF